MTKAITAGLLATGLIAAPLLPLTQSAAQAQTETKKETKTEAKPKKGPSAGMLAMRARQKKCGAEWKEAKAAGQDREGPEGAAVLERVQQASQGRGEINSNFELQKTEGVGET